MVCAAILIMFPSVLLSVSHVNHYIFDINQKSYYNSNKACFLRLYSLSNSLGQEALPLWLQQALACPQPFDAVMKRRCLVLH